MRLPLGDPDAATGFPVPAAPLLLGLAIRTDHPSGSRATPLRPARSPTRMGALATPSLLDCTLAPLPAVTSPRISPPPSPSTTGRESEREPAFGFIHAEAGPSRPGMRISRLPPTPTLPSAAPSSRNRYYYIGVRSGKVPGVYTSWTDAEKQMLMWPNPSYRTFSTRLAAEAYVTGWEGAGRHSLPGSSPRPLREHLAMNFPQSASVTPSSKRPSYHARLLATLPAALEESAIDNTAPTSLEASSTRPEMVRSSSSFRTSVCKISSPLRQEVDDAQPIVSVLPSPKMRKAASVIGIGGLLSPPLSPNDQLNSGSSGSIMDRPRPMKRSEMTEGGFWSSGQHRVFSTKGASPLSPPSSPLASSADGHKRAATPVRSATGLWANVNSPSPQALPQAVSAPLAPPPHLELPSADKAAPKFSRAALKKSGVVMPTAAPRTNSSSSLRSGSRTSLNSPSATSLSSAHSGASHSTLRRPPADRLVSLAETSRRELQLNEEGLLALGSLSPPRPAFMRRMPSDSSFTSESSMDSLTSAASSSNTKGESVELGEIQELEEHGRDVEVQISCTKSDGDVDGSQESGSIKSGHAGGAAAKRKGGMFKRLTKAIGLEKKTMPGNEAGRRPSM